MLFCLYAKGIHFGLNLNLGAVHQSPYKDIKEAIQLLENEPSSIARQFAKIFKYIEEKLPYTKKWTHDFDWSVGMYLGYRWILPQRFFIDWNFLDFSNGISLTRLNFGKILSDKWAVYGIFNPCVGIIHANTITIYSLYNEARTMIKRRQGEPKELIIKAFQKNPTLPFAGGIGLGLGFGFSYKISPRVSLIGEYNFQVSYWNAVSILRNMSLDNLDQTILYEAKHKGEGEGETKREKNLKNISNALKNVKMSTLIRQRVTVGFEFHGARHND